MKVEPIMGETLGFWVQSNSNPEMRHRVDLGEGACGCASFVCNRAKWAATYGVQFRCRHIDAAREYFTNECISKVLEIQLSQ